MVGFLMQKITMTSLCDKNNNDQIVPVLILKTNSITCLQKIENNGKYVVFLGFFNIEPKDFRKFSKSFLNSNYRTPTNKPRFVRQFKVTKEVFDKFEIGKNVNISDFINVGQKVKISGRVKGRGFTGGMKRHNFSGQPASHGISISHRSIGSTGSRKPRRVIKGRKMPGHYGTHVVTHFGIKVVEIRENNIVIIKGNNVPGCNGSVVMIHSTNF